MAGGHELFVRAARDLMPPNVAIEFPVHFQRQMRAAHLDEGIAVTGQRERTAEIEFFVELQVQLLVLRGPQNNFRRMLEHPQDHRAGSDADADVVFDDVPSAAALDGGDANRLNIHCSANWRRISSPWTTLSAQRY